MTQQIKIDTDAMFKEQLKSFAENLSEEEFERMYRVISHKMGNYLVCKKDDYDMVGLKVFNKVSSPDGGIYYISSDFMG